MVSDSPRGPRLAWPALVAMAASTALVPMATVGCEPLLGLGPEPDRDRSSTAVGTSATSSTSGGGHGGASTGDATATSAGGGEGGARSSYADVVAEDGPLVHLRLGDASGPTAAAAIGEAGVYLEAGDDGLAFGEPGAIVGDPDTAVRFGGGGIDLGDVFDPSGLRPFTFEVWLKPLPAPEEYYQRIFSKEAGTDLREGVLVWLQGGQLRLERWQTGEEHFASTYDVPLDRFFHLVATFDGASVTLYVDGEEAMGQVFGEVVSVSADLDPLTVGRASYDDESHPTFAVLDEVAVYELALSPGRIALHHQIGTGR